MIRRALMLVVLLALVAGPAMAAPVKPPAGWTTDPAAAVSMSKRLAEVPHFGGLPASPTTEVYRTKGASLFVTRTFAAVKPEERDRAVTIELDEIDAPPRRAGSNATESTGGRRVIPDHKLLEGRRSWKDSSTNVVTASRMIVAADDKQVVAITGECVLAGDAADDVVKACHAALASLDPEIPVAARVQLNLAASAVSAPPEVPKGSAQPSAPAILEGGDRPALPPMQIPQETPPPDRRPVYVGLGLVVLAVLFWWNRKNREKLERAYEERVDGAQKGEQREPREQRDADADDLHAAASESGTKPEEPPKAPPNEAPEQPPKDSNGSDEEQHEA